MLPRSPLRQPSRKHELSINPSLPYPRHHPDHPGLRAGTGVTALREYLKNPLGIDISKPRLSWQLDADKGGQKQTAYQIQAASRPELLKLGRADLWDTGKVASGETAQIVYQGQPLPSRQRVCWRVRVWNSAHKPSKWSETAFWSMGLDQPADWQASYISYRDTTPIHKDKDTLFLPAARQYRKEFDVGEKIVRATIYSTALGIYELHFNGRRVGDQWFAPGWTDYHQRAYYRTYDVTDMVRKGPNALAAWVADGWYSGYMGFGLLTGIGTERIGRYTYGKTPAFMAQLEIEYADGSRQTVPTDTSWKVTGEGPIRQADFLMGEFYDARQDTPGWTSSGYADSTWENAILAEQNGHPSATFYEWQNPTADKKLEIVGHPIDLGFKRPARLEAFPGAPVRAMEEIGAIALTSHSNGVHIFNLGQNFAGVIRLKVKGNAGTIVHVRYGEMLHQDGRLMTENLRKARATDYYVLRGDAKGETYMPRFTFHGFQYVELTGLNYTPKLGDVTGIGTALGHPADQRLRMLRPDGEQAIQEHRLDSTRQFP